MPEDIFKQGGFVRHGRRRSADVGGLHLATGNNGQGQGWVGYEEGEMGDLQTRFAELLSDMYNETLHAVNEHNPEFAPTDCPTETRFRLIESLDRWNFEPHKLPDEEVLACTLILFEALFRIEGMEEAVAVSMTQITALIHHLRQIYRWQNSYHNFEHALDVLQAAQSFLRSAGMVPPLSILLEGDDRMWIPDKEFDSGPLITSLGLRDLFVIYIAAIGHDVGHPGFTNVFMKNAQTPLSVVYDGKSALEQMHCQLLLHVMRQHGLGALLDSPNCGTHVRRLLWEIVLATDMSVHFDFMARFKSIVDGQDGSICLRQILISQAIMKCSDISNPSRPYHVSQHWASALMEEWTSQAILEKHLDLPCTVQPSDNPLSEARSQVFFITTFAKPLLDLMVQAIPEMHVYAQQCASNLTLWEARCIELEDVAEKFKDAVIKPELPSTPTSPRQPDDFLTAFPLTLPLSHRTPQHEDITPIWSHSSPRSSGSSCGSSESGPCSPCESVGSFLISPNSDMSASNLHPPSTFGSSNTNNGNADIRAAGKAGMRKLKSLNRNSWSASSTSPHSNTSYPRSTVALVVSTATSSVLTPTKTATETIMVSPIKLERGSPSQS